MLLRPVIHLCLIFYSHQYEHATLTARGVGNARSELSPSPLAQSPCASRVPQNRAPYMLFRLPSSGSRDRLAPNRPLYVIQATDHDSSNPGTDWCDSTRKMPSRLTFHDMSSYLNTKTICPGSLHLVARTGKHNLCLRQT